MRWRDDVVELAGDVEAGLGDAAAGLFLSGRLGPGGTVLRGLDGLAAAAHGVTGGDGQRRPGDAGQQFGAEEVPGLQHGDGGEQRGGADEADAHRDGPLRSHRRGEEQHDARGEERRRMADDRGQRHHGRQVDGEGGIAGAGGPGSARVRQRRLRRRPDRGTGRPTARRPPARTRGATGRGRPGATGARRTRPTTSATASWSARSARSARSGPVGPPVGPSVIGPRYRWSTGADRRQGGRVPPFPFRRPAGAGRPWRWSAARRPRRRTPRTRPRARAAGRCRRRSGTTGRRCSA